MASISPTSLIPILILILITQTHPSESTTRPLPSPTTTLTPQLIFLQKACNSTTYPSLCLSSLSSFSSTINTSPVLLAHTALSLTIDHARSTSSSIKSLSSSRPREAQAVRDCLDNLDDSIHELSASLTAMRDLRAGPSPPKDLAYRINSIQTWVSAALTDDDSCMEGFGGKDMDGTVKTAVRGNVVNVAHLTSNALALVNALASNYYPADP